MPADPATLATTAEGVFAIGDVTAIPLAGGKFLPKAGVFAEAQAKVVARNIAAELAGHQPTATFGSAGACFVELGDRRAAAPEPAAASCASPTARCPPSAWAPGTCAGSAPMSWPRPRPRSARAAPGWWTIPTAAFAAFGSPGSPGKAPV